MRTVHEVSELAGVSIRTLRYYDRIGLLRPAGRTEAGYRMYDEGNLERLQQILLLRELEFSLKDIGEILDSPNFDRREALRQQIGLLELRRERIEQLIDLASGLMEKGVGTMSFEAFDTSRIDEYAAQARAAWGDGPEWREYEERRRGRTAEGERAMGEELMGLFSPFGRMAAEGADPTCEEAAKQAERIQDFISEHFYTCSDKVFLQLGRSYGSGGEFTRNIDAAAGDGAGAFAMHAIEAYLTGK
ncbi:MAG: MerR family transcriptional regulator [Olsenella sp.]|nr:MerR family transcriptional regulator [Olsenella sp.]